MNTDEFNLSQGSPLVNKGRVSICSDFETPFLLKSVKEKQAASFSVNQFNSPHPDGAQVESHPNENSDFKIRKLELCEEPPSNLESIYRDPEPEEEVKDVPLKRPVEDSPQAPSKRKPAFMKEESGFHLFFKEAPEKEQEYSQVVPAAEPFAPVPMIENSNHHDSDRSSRCDDPVQLLVGQAPSGDDVWADVNAAIESYQNDKVNVCILEKKVGKRFEWQAPSVPAKKLSRKKRLVENLIPTANSSLVNKTQRSNLLQPMPPMKATTCLHSLSESLKSVEASMKLDQRRTRYSYCPRNEKVEQQPAKDSKKSEQIAKKRPLDVLFEC